MALAKGRKGLMALCVWIACFWMGARPSPAAGRETPKRPVILVHYMPWFEAKPALHQWGWHWTMNAFDPEKIVDGKRSLASHYYPLIGPYDSGDPTVLEYHLLLMKLAGVDGIVVDWYGLSNLYDYPLVHRNTQALFAVAEKLGLKVAICYEDQTVSTLIAQKRLTDKDRVSHVAQELAWMQENWFSRPTYLKLNDKPVLLSFGYSGLTDDEWGQALKSLPAPPLYLSEHNRRPSANGSFDWPRPQKGLAGLRDYSLVPQGDSILMPVAFPRFQDIYQQAKVHDSYGEIPDAGGQTFTTTLERALKSGAPFVQIATWNDWGEGTGIEPSKEVGYRDLETLLKSSLPTHVSAGVSPDDLRLPYRLWVLRGHQAERPMLKPELDHIASLLAAGTIASARAALTQVEARIK